MQKEIQVLLTEQAKDFMQRLERHERRKIGETIRRVQDGQQGDWFKKLAGSDDIWEFRTNVPPHTYRLFAFWDNRQPTATLIVCTHGLDKKTPKTPPQETTKAERIKQEYFAQS